MPSGKMMANVAKDLFLQDHPGQHRIPAGFAKSMKMELVRIDSGSTIPVLRIPTEQPSLKGFETQPEEYLKKARDLITETVAIAEAALKNGHKATLNVGQQYLRNFNIVGRKLRQDEGMEFDNLQNGIKPTLTPESRIWMLEKANLPITKEVALRGKVTELDVEKRYFHVRPTNGALRVKVPFEEKHEGIIMHALNQHKEPEYKGKGLILIQGIGKYSHNQLTKIESIEQIDPLDPTNIPARLESFHRIKPGWYEGQGKAFNTTELAWLANQFEECYPSNLAPPKIAPTVDGTIEMEWDNDHHVVFLEINPGTRQAEWFSYQPPSQDEVEKNLDLNNPEDWQWLINKIHAKLGENHG